ncbi:NAD-dependent epimerase/dehydratase family protein [Candidatus Methylopumilus planktonicus]|uniref:NAD-dependent epimerase/dehydratase family protein n=1 Tax=Candidatus Methylopumilus planktonicus TaxID=1581557 RepID=UPI003BEED8DA
MKKKLSLNTSRVKRACVSGGSGFIGAKLVEKLISQGFSVRVLTRNSRSIFPEGVEIFCADLTSPTCILKSFFSGCDIFFHCAGELNNSMNMSTLHEDGIQRLLKAFSDEKDLTSRRMHWVQLSSAGVYGKLINHPAKVRKISELSRIHPFAEYEVTKAKADNLLLEAAKSSKFTFSILRPTTIVGLDMSNQSFRHLVESIIKRNFFYIGSINSLSNYIHVDDVVSLLLLCSRSSKATNQIFNLSNDCKLSDIVLSLSLYKKIKHTNTIVPEWLVRFIVFITPSFFNLPLTQKRIDALVSKTHYSNSKIKRILKFSPKRFIPEFAVEYFKATCEK